MLPVVIERLRHEMNVPEGSRQNGQPLVMHDAVRRHLCHERRQRLIHENGTAHHIVLHQQLLQPAAPGTHFLVLHKGRRQDPEFSVGDLRIAVHEERCFRPVSDLHGLHFPETARQLLRFPDIVLIRQHDVVAVPGTACRKKRQKMPPGSARGGMRRQKRDPVRMRRRHFPEKREGAVRGAVVRNQDAEVLRRVLVQNGVQLLP